MRKSLRGKQIVACGTLVALIAATTAAPALAVTASPVQQALDRVTAQGGAPGAEAVVTDHGRVTETRSGVGDLTTGKPYPHDAVVRVGSITKTFVATVVLQLVAEGKVRLDDPIERYLPGLITGNGNDGAKITVRNLLQHTSGLYSYTDDVLATGDLESLRHRGAEPGELVALALNHPPLFAPGTAWSYSNTNYIVAGMLVEKVTGHGLAGEITRRITRPLGLHDTSLPGRGDERLPSPHPRGYVTLGGPLTDFTDFDPSIAWAAGALVSTGRDLDTFYTALIGGRLLPAAQLAQMQHTVPVPGEPGTDYGLGLFHRTLPDGTRYWGHGGDIFGFATLSGALDGRRGATVSANEDPLPDNVRENTEAAFEVSLARR
ncbi:serine hydrolase domain-containing protein [Amycolatopsis sp., V23-08]|uniref:Serine hydrolase domain-containing protein n=1 Tax=Amycolatopsis heterodermiae TaxID=3110235 RepID=A0ABU5R953_9PSEU|nr:serine hydrolase domain-containing protein [Amycolatopsis sp., V23-08]MEA5362772.1 serine hydrolase domain-containing protein [Amycolatopsis sp., V23-08]